MKKGILYFWIFLFSFNLASACEPVVRDGKFYNDINDNHNHILTGLKILAHTIWNYPFGQSESSESVADLYQPSIPPKQSDKPLVWSIGHATFLIQAHENILTDPVFGNIRFHQRFTPPSIKPEDLPPIHKVLISHDHYDHLDIPSLKQIKHHNPLIMVPVGLKALLKDEGFENVEEYTWHEKQVNEHGSITFLPAYHWSGRSPFSIRKSLWGSWLIESNNHSIYFAGDTAYADHFKEIGKNHTINTALLPIAPTEPHEYTKDAHMNPQEAIKAFEDLHADTFIPMHHGTFRLGPDSPRKPLETLQTCWNQTVSDKTKQLIALRAGQSYEG